MIDEFLNQSIQLKRAIRDGQGKLQLDGYANPTYTAPVSVAARVEEKRSKTRDKNGDEVMSQTTVFVGNIAITVDDKVIFDDGREVFIISVEPQPDLMGDVDHKRVYA